MAACCAFGCTSRPSKKIPGITFHKFPAHDKERKQLWVKAIRRKDWSPSPCTQICSLHFEEQYIDRSMTRVLLRKNAVPTVFSSVPSYYQNNKTKRKSSKCRLSESEYQNSMVIATHTNIKSESQVVHSPSTSNSTLDPVGSLCVNIGCKRALDDANEKVNLQLKKIKTLNQKVRRYSKKIVDLQSIISELHKKRYIPEDMIETLKKTAENELFSRQLKKITNVSQPKSYSPELRAFALTLRFYSVRAYNYVRKSFQFCLPHPRTITKWCQHIDGKPWFTTEAWNAISAKDEQLCEKLKLVIPRANKKLASEDDVCELQFHESDIERHFITTLSDGTIHKIPREIPSLKQGAIPILYPNLPARCTITPVECEESSMCTSVSNEITTTKSSKENTTTLDTNLEEFCIFNSHTLSTKEKFSFNDLLKVINLIKVPSEWWSVTPITNSIICVKWNNLYAVERKVVVKNDLSVMAFIKDCQIHLSDLEKVSDVEDISAVLQKIDELVEECTGVDNGFSATL